VNRNDTTRWICRLVVGLVAAGFALTGAGAEPARLGMAFDDDPMVEGRLDGVGRPLYDGDLLKALDRAAVARLDNGQVLRLAANSSLLLRGGPDDEVEVTVLSGRVVVSHATGRPLVAGPGSRFALAPTYQDAEEAEARVLGFDLSAPRHRVDEPETATPLPRDRPGRGGRR